MAERALKRQTDELALLFPFHMQLIVQGVYG